jgi:hypothetical protein
MSDPGCAVCSNGILKDASDIEWHFDKDDETPMALSMPLQPPPPPTQCVHDVHPFFTGHKVAAAPVAIIAGSRCSNRAICPSAHITDPDNAMNKANSSTSAQPSSSVGEKCKAPHSEPACHVVQKVIADSDGKGQTDIGSNLDDDGHSTQADSDVEEVQQEFEAIQAMADDNHQV